MDRWRGKVAVVTGASAGIGAAISKRLAEEGLQVVGLARRVERVEELIKGCKGTGKLHALKCDVSKKEDVISVFKRIKENIGPIQILVNNAGIFRQGRLIDGNPDDWKSVLDTNVMGLAMCSREAFLQMKESGLEGHIIHINSIAGHSKMSGKDPLWTNIYSPSKNAVTCITEIMRKEITHGKYPVKITSVSPGAVKTEIGEAAGVSFDVAYDNIPMLSSEDISDSVYYVISTPPNVNIQELTIRPVGEGNFD